MSKLQEQVGGDHYKKGIQPLEYSFHNDLDGFQTKVIKYITRWRDKGGLQDLQKCEHVLQMYIELVQKHGDSRGCKEGEIKNF